MRVVITGGAGFIGSNCAHSLLEGGHDVVVLDNFATGSATNLLGVERDLEIIEGDIRDPGVVVKAVAGADAVIHLAALGSVPRSIDDPFTTHDVNVTGTLNVLLASRDHNVGRVLFSSSSSVYGSNPELPKFEHHRGDVLSPYALSKLAGEEYCRLFWDLYQLPTVRVRFFNVFGPRQAADHVYAAVIPKFIAAAQASRPFLIDGDGLQSRDFTFVDNIVNGLSGILRSPAERVAGRAFNMACGSSISILDVAEQIKSLVGDDVTWTHGPPRAGDIRNSLADNSEALNAFGYKADIGASVGIERTIQWFNDQRLGGNSD